MTTQAILVEETSSEKTLVAETTEAAAANKVAVETIETITTTIATTITITTITLITETSQAPAETTGTTTTEILKKDIDHSTIDNPKTLKNSGFFVAPCWLVLQQLPHFKTIHYFQPLNLEFQI